MKKGDYILGFWRGYPRDFWKPNSVEMPIVAKFLGYLNQHSFQCSRFHYREDRFYFPEEDNMAYCLEHFKELHILTTNNAPHFWAKFRMRSNRFYKEQALMSEYYNKGYQARRIALKHFLKVEVLSLTFCLDKLRELASQPLTDEIRLEAFAYYSCYRTKKVLQDYYNFHFTGPPKKP